MTAHDLAGVPVLVTGGAGFIGSHLVDALLERGAVVRVLDNLATGRLENLAHCRDRIELVEADLRDRDACRAACDGRRVVFHQAALGSVPRSIEDPVTTLGVNVQGTAHVFDACRLAGVERVVYASSSSVYGDSEELPKVEGREGRPLSPYAASKVMTEELAAVFARTYSMTLVGLRYFNVYGPRQDPEGPYAAVIPRFFRACLADRSPSSTATASRAATSPSSPTRSRPTSWPLEPPRRGPLSPTSPADAGPRSTSWRGQSRRPSVCRASRCTSLRGPGTSATRWPT